MKIRCVALLLCLLAIPASSLYGQLQSPADFLGYEIGERWTPHHRVMQYVKHVAEESELVKVESYGTTYEHRELVVPYDSTFTSSDSSATCFTYCMTRWWGRV